MLLLASTAQSVPNWHGCIDDKAKALPYCDTKLSIDQRLDDLLGRMNLDDKIAQIMPQPNKNTCNDVTKGKAEIGLPEWMWLVETNSNIASRCTVEGHCATTFTGPMGMGASFNRTSWRLKGSVMGTEMRAFSNINGERGCCPDSPIGLTGYGPNINIARDPRFGRSSEVPGEDPFLSGTYAYHMVSGMQEKDEHGYPKMAAFLKHFTAYSTESNRGHDSYTISRYDFADTYLPQYERVFVAQPAGVMCSYNAENGSPSCASNWLLNKMLRSWKPDAIVSTDCGAVNNLRGPPVNAPDDATAAAYALMNGTDLEMGDVLFSALGDAVKRGLATAERITEAARRTFKIHFELGRFDPPEASSWSKFGLNDVNSSLHQQISYEAAAQGLVLLKNDNILPLKAGVRLAIVGPQAQAQEGLLEDYAADHICFNGTYGCIITIEQGLREANKGGSVVVSPGVGVVDTSADGIKAALDAAQAADVVVLALGTDRMHVEHEGRDRTDTALPGIQEPFALKVLALNKPTILVLTNGGALAIDNLMQRAAGQTAGYAIIEAFNPGPVGALALARGIFGLENRWGKLPVTIYPHDYINQQPMTNYDMSLAPGRTYKYYQGKPLFPFGFGLSLTNFALSCSQQASLSFACTVTNTGNLDGEEVVIVYHRAKSIGIVDHPLPLRALVEFERVAVAAKQSVTVNFKLSNQNLLLVNKEGERVLYPGSHELIFTNGQLETAFAVVVEPSSSFRVVI